MPPRLIVNPTAGGGRGGPLADRASRLLRRYGLDHEVVSSRSPADPIELAREAVRDRCPVVIGVGGDGLVSQVASGLVGSESSLGIIPTGVGNDFARGLGIPLDVDRASAVLAQGTSRQIDVGQVNNRYFFSVAVMGFAARVNRRANRFRRFRVNALYSALTVASIFIDTPIPFRVVCDGRERCCYSWLIAVGNTWSCARGMALVPSAQPDDGLLDACMVNGMGKLNLLLNAFPRVFRGTHVYHTGIETLRGRQFEVQAEAPCEVYADGERIGPLPAVLRLLPGALRVIMPPG